MEIEFNASRVPKPGYNEPVRRQVASESAPPSTEVSQSTASLQSKLRELPLVRPEQTAQAQALVAEEKYPPNDVLDRIAVLLAIQMKK